MASAEGRSRRRRGAGARDPCRMRSTPLASRRAGTKQPALVVLEYPFHSEGRGVNAARNGREKPADRSELRMAQVRARENGTEGRPGEAPPRDFERFRALLLDRRDGLPSRLVRAAEHALAHPDEIAFGTVASVAEAAAIQPSALIRFAKALGYNGFSELQEVFRHRLRERWPDYGERLAKLRHEGPPEGPAGLLKRFSEGAVRSLGKLDDTV